MDYCSVTEIASQWGLSPRMVAIHCAKGHVPHAKKFQGIWLIPKDTPRPEDRRKHKKTETEVLSKQEQKAQTAGEHKTAKLVRDIHGILQPHSPYASFDEEPNKALAQLYRTEQSYLRGDFAQVLKDFQTALPGSAMKLWHCPLAIASAISLGDYAAYQTVDSYLKYFEAPYQPIEIRKSAEYCRATTAVSALAAAMVPPWIIDGDLSGLPALIRPPALYLRAKYYYMLGKYEISLTIARTGLSLIDGQSGFTCPRLYFTIVCAASHYGLGQLRQAEQYLRPALRQALPLGYVIPFAELIPILGGLVEECMAEEFPQQLPDMLRRCDSVCQNWVQFHNRFTQENIPHILSLREYHIVRQISRGRTYRTIARQQKISVGRLKNLLLDIREKLCLSDADRLEDFIL